MSISERLAEFLRNLGKEKPKPFSTVVGKTEQPAQPIKGQALAREKIPDQGRVTMRTAAEPARPTVAPKEAPLLRRELQAKVEVKTKGQPASKKLDVLLEEAGPSINLQLAGEIKQLSHVLEQPPSREQWTQIQESLGRISRYSDVKVIEAAKIVQKEVHQYTFSQVVTHAEEYGLRKSDAPEVAKTFREATVAGYRDLRRKNPDPIPHTEVQQSLEQALVDAEIQREWDTVSQIAKDAQARKDIQESDEKAEKLREAEDLTVEEAKARIKEIIAEYPKEERMWMEKLLGNVQTNKEAASFLLTITEAGPDALTSPAYLYAKGGQWRKETYDWLMKQPLPLSKEAIEARAVQKTLADVVVELNHKPLKAKEHRVDFSKVDKAMVDINLRFEGTFGGAPYTWSGLEWWAEGANNKGALYGSTRTINNPGPVGVTQIDDFLTKAQLRIDTDLKGAQNLDLMNQLQHEYQDLLRDLMNPARKGGAIPIPDAAYQYLNDISQNLRDLIEKSRDHISLGLTGDYKEEIWLDGPEKALYRKLREVEETTKSYEGDTFRSQTAMRSLEQMASYITDPRFANEWRRDLLAQGVSLAGANARIESFMNNGLDVLSNNVDWRRNLVKLYSAYLSQGVTEELFAKMLSPFGSEGYLGILNLYDGKVSAAFDYFDAATLSAHRENHSDDLLWLSPDKLKTLYKKATEEMKNGSVAVFEGLAKHQIEEIAFLAQEAHFISGRTVLAMNRGLGPLEQTVYAPGTRPDRQHGFGGGGGSNIERHASSRKPLRFGFLRWNLENEGTRAMLDSDALFAAGGNHVEEVVDRVIADAQRRGRVEDLVRYVSDLSSMDVNPTNPDHASIIEGRLNLTYLSRDSDGNKRPPPKTLPEAARNIPVLKERMMSKIGLNIVENSIMSYTMLDSGPICLAAQNKLSEMFTYHDQLAISMQLRDAYNSLLGARNHDARAAALRNLDPVLRKAARFNPTDLLNGHVDTRNFAVDDWFASLNTAEINSFLSADQLAAGGAQCTGDLIKVVTRIDANIESLLKREVRQGHHYGRIDWTQFPMRGEHYEVVRKALRAATGKPAGTDAEIGLNNFINLKTSMSTFVGRPDMISAATQMDFATRYGYQTNNSADCWLDLTEDPRFGNKGNGSINKLSEELGRRGSGDLFVREHGDAETALKAKDVLFQAIQTLDWKEYVKAFREIRFLARNVYGQPWDGRMFMYYTAGLLEASSQDLLTEMTFEISRLIRPKDSKLRRILNSEHAPSDPIEDRFEKIGDMENTIAQSLEAVDHELAEYFLKYVHMNFGPGHHLVQNDILWVKRAYRVAAFGSILLAVGLIKEGTEEFGVGGGGGGGGGHH